LLKHIYMFWFEKQNYAGRLKIEFFTINQTELKIKLLCINLYIMCNETYGAVHKARL